MNVDVADLDNNRPRKLLRSYDLVLRMNSLPLNGEQLIWGLRNMPILTSTMVD
jgi:hypothetical protein